MSSYYAYQHAKNHESTAVAQDENLDKQGCQLCEEGSKSAKEGECKFCAKDALVEALEEKEEEVSPNGEAEGTIVAVKDAENPEFEEEKHPRGKKGEKGAGQFKTKPETIEKEDDLASSSADILEGIKKDFKSAKTQEERANARTKRLEAFYGAGHEPTMEALKKIVAKPDSAELEDLGYSVVENEWDVDACYEAADRGNLEYALAQDIYSYWFRQNPKAKQTTDALYNRTQARAWVKRNIWDAYEAHRKGKKWEYEPIPQ